MPVYAASAGDLSGGIDTIGTKEFPAGTGGYKVVEVLHLTARVQEGVTIPAGGHPLPHDLARSVDSLGVARGATERAQVLYGVLRAYRGAVWDSAIPLTTTIAATIAVHSTVARLILTTLLFV